MKRTADDIYRLDLQKPTIPLSCPRCGKSRIVILALPGGQYSIPHTCPDGMTPVEMRFNARAEAVVEWNKYARSANHDGQGTDS